MEHVARLYRMCFFPRNVKRVKRIVGEIVVRPICVGASKYLTTLVRAHRSGKKTYRTNCSNTRFDIAASSNKKSKDIFHRRKPFSQKVTLDNRRPKEATQHTLTAMTHIVTQNNDRASNGLFKIKTNMNHEQT